MIIFKKIIIKNFLSVGNKPIELELNTHNITSISGENGSAKSAICIDSIFYALYGKSFRKVSLPKLINSYNQKCLLVELYFSINQKEYKIIRGQKPSIFEIYIDNVLKPPMANVKDYQNFLVNQVLKMDEKTFRQLVVIGSSSYTPFMNLTAAERRVVIEQLLRIDIFSSMSILTKQYLSEANTLLGTLEHKIDTLSMKIELQHKNDIAILQQIESSIQECETEINELTNKKNEQEKLYTSLLSKIDNNLMTSLKNKSKKISNDLSVIKQLRMKKLSQEEQVDKIISFFEKNNICPTCTQKLDEIFVYDKIKELSQKKNNYISDLKIFDEKILELQNTYNESVEKFNILIDEFKKIENIKKDISTIESNINLCVKQKNTLLEKITKAKNTESIDVKKYTRELQDTKEKFDICNQKIKALSIIQNLLKDDGVKSIIIKSYLNIINALISKYLNIIGYNVVFELDENFNESIHTKHMETFEYNNFSEGEKLRLDSAIMFAFRDLAKLRSSISTNILILDEFDHGTLDNTGFESVVEILKSCKDQNIFIISHTTDYFNAIADRNLIAIKKNNFSELKVL